jgi:hypothetical protein
MRSIMVSTDVYAGIWSQRRPGEESEDAILRRLLLGGSQEAETSPDTAPPPAGLVDRRYGVHFGDGFTIFRTYLGTEFRARVRGGRWVLETTGQDYGSLNELSQAVGAKAENAWVNWFFLDPDGERQPVSALRDPSKIARRTRAANAGEIISAGANTHHGEEDMLDPVTWRDDVRDALQRLGGKARLHALYQEVERTRRGVGRSVPRTLDATVRRTLEDHSSDSENYRGGLDLFCMPEGRGAGVWALRAAG